MNCNSNEECEVTLDDVKHIITKVEEVNVDEFLQELRELQDTVIEIRVLVEEGNYCVTEKMLRSVKRARGSLIRNFFGTPVVHSDSYRAIE
ncbi:MAG: hypothetical protein C4294_20440 [Nitrospiraceae bacterium]